MKKLILAVSAATALFATGPGLAQPAATEPETVRVQAAPLTDAVVTGFVKSFTAPAELSGHIPTWVTGICLKTEGLPPELGDAVSKRIRDVAKMVGAKVLEQPCKLNTVVFFDADPQALLDDIAANHPDLLGPHDQAQIKDLSKVRFPVQAWYATETQDLIGKAVVDSKERSGLCESFDMSNMVADTGTLRGGGNRNDLGKQAEIIRSMQQYCGHRDVTGNRLRDGLHSHIVAVTAVASMEAVRSHELGALADYLALVILSQTQAFEKCQKMDTVANLLVPRCDLDNRINGLTQGDIAYLKALYKADTGGNLVAQQASISGEMKKLLAAEH